MRSRLIGSASMISRALSLSLRNIWRLVSHLAWLISHLLIVLLLLLLRWSNHLLLLVLSLRRNLVNLLLLRMSLLHIRTRANLLIVLCIINLGILWWWMNSLFRFMIVNLRWCMMLNLLRKMLNIWLSEVWSNRKMLSLLQLCLWCELMMNPWLSEWWSLVQWSRRSTHRLVILNRPWEVWCRLNYYTWRLLLHYCGTCVNTVVLRRATLVSCWLYSLHK